MLHQSLPGLSCFCLLRAARGICYTGYDKNQIADCILSICAIWNGGVSMSPQTAKWACYILRAAGFVLILLVVVHFCFLLFGLLMVVAAIVISLLFYRCPY